jgi:hypothetical protein
MAAPGRDGRTQRSRWANESSAEGDVESRPPDMARMFPTRTLRRTVLGCGPKPGPVRTRPSAGRSVRPILCGPSQCGADWSTNEPLRLSTDRDPADRRVDRLLARLGLLAGAALAPVAGIEAGERGDHRVTVRGHVPSVHAPARTSIRATAMTRSLGSDRNREHDETALAHGILTTRAPVRPPAAPPGNPLQPAVRWLCSPILPRSKFNEMERPRGAMHCEWVVLVVLVSFDEPVTGPSTRSPEVPAAAAMQRSSIAIHQARAAAARPWVATCSGVWARRCR